MNQMKEIHDLHFKQGDSPRRLELFAKSDTFSLLWKGKEIDHNEAWLAEQRLCQFRSHLKWWHILTKFVVVNTVRGLNSSAKHSVTTYRKRVFNNLAASRL
jgi:hypothetical protein